MSIFVRLSRFALVGICSTAFHLLTTLILVHAGKSLIFSNSIAFVIAFTFSYAAQSYFTFRSRPTALNLAGFAASAMMAFIASQSFAWIWTELEGNPSIGACISVSIHATVSFIVNNFVVFKQESARPSSED